MPWSEGGASQRRSQDFSFAPWGAPKKAPEEIKFNFGNSNNPFSSGYILPSEAVNGYEWKVNSQQQFAVAISLIGDNTGKYIATKSTSQGIATGSPLTRDEAIEKIITDSVGKPGEITKLKKLLDEKQMYNSAKAGQQSVLAGDALDPNLYSALATALDAATAFNSSIAAQQGNVSNPKIYSFNEFLMAAPKGGSYEGSSFGTGGRRTQITHQKFNPEDFDIAIDQLFQQTIGRGASEQELNDFVSKLQSYEKKNPQKTVSVTSGNTTRITQSGGVSADIMQSQMREAALNNPEAENYNKATKYLDYFMQAIDNPIELG